MIEPVLRDEAFLADVAAASGSGLHVWWVGQSGFLVDWSGWGEADGGRILFDPYLSDSLTEKYCDTDKPHVRMTRRVVAPEKLEGIDLATSTHAHTDHLDSLTLRALRSANPGLKLVHPSTIAETVRERTGDWGEDLIGINGGERIEIGPFTVHAVAAAHNEVARDGEGRNLYLGYVVEIGPWTIYHSGDTLLHEGLVPALAPFAIDLALLPINGNRPERRVAGNLDGKEAAELAHAIRAGCVVPCHYEMFEFNTASPALFEDSCKRLGQAYRILGAGERLTLEK